MTSFMGMLKITQGLFPVLLCAVSTSAFAPSLLRTASPGMGSGARALS
eukprot:CAMPEP_0181329876 /NCGR_PEP_ID=MMETSP1101-20121128/23567_1 /TAXON_ID=46948 /ORGANISM="Rhodomonas abbreviata, Strain Caron Lab Isolate" /LENGTH=47 /DNA_ID= /DNA_START= /DNA_END= /DNA_ORIENTATION=